MVVCNFRTIKQLENSANRLPLPLPLPAESSSFSGLGARMSSSLFRRLLLLLLRLFVIANFLRPECELAKWFKISLSSDRKSKRDAGCDEVMTSIGSWTRDVRGGSRGEPRPINHKFKLRNIKHLLRKSTISKQYNLFVTQNKNSTKCVWFHTPSSCLYGWQLLLSLWIGFWSLVRVYCPDIYFFWP